jgi:hypothetical protein
MTEEDEQRFNEELQEKVSNLLAENTMLNSRIMMLENSLYEKTTMLNSLIESQMAAKIKKTKTPEQIEKIKFYKKHKNDQHVIEAAKKSTSSATMVHWTKIKQITDEMFHSSLNSS